MPVPRLRIRTLMIAVALAAVPFWLYGRSRYLRGLADYHEAQAAENHKPGPVRRGGDSPVYTVLVDEANGVRAYRELTPRGVWHFKLRTKYRDAASRPWLPVPPDPPAPE